jgi:hypothetical protein
MSQPEQCELCSATAVPLHERCGANVCRSCLTLLWFAEVLLESDATEAEIVPTLAFARHADALWTISNPQQRENAAHQLVERYAALELVDIESGVPMLRMKPAFAEVVRYEGSNLAKRIRIRVLSRFAEPRAMAELYWDICEREGLPRHKTSPGSLSWDRDRMHMVVDVGPREDIHPARLHQHTEYPQVRRFAFPWSKSTPLYPPLEHLSPVDGLPGRTLGFAHLRGGCAQYLVRSACGLLCSALLLSFALA